MSEEQQAAFDEDYEVETDDAQGIEQQQAETDEPQVESATTENDEQETNNVEKRINKLTAEKYAEKRKAEALEARLKELENGSTNQAATAPEGKPTLEQFDYDDAAFQEALIDWRFQENFKATQTAAQKAQAEQIANERDARFDQAEVKYATDHPEYIQDINNLPRFQPDTLNVLRTQDNGPELVHYLGKNPEIADQIAKLDPYNAAVKIGVISAKLSANGTTTNKPSAAPDPIDSIKTGGSGINDNMSPHAKGAIFE